MGTLQKTGLKLVLLVISSGVALGVAELGIRVFHPQPTDYFFFPDEPRPGTRYERWGLEVRLNQWGNRDYEYSVEKKGGAYRIVILGDSIEYGTGVPMEEVYGKRLEQMLNAEYKGSPRFEVLLFTQGGNAPAGYLEMLTDEALKFDPDLVMVGFTLNDFERPNQKQSIRNWYYDGLREVHIRMRIWSHLYYLAVERSRAFLYRQQILDKSVRYHFDLAILEARSDEFTEAWEYTRPNLDKIGATAAQVGAGFAIVVFPYELQMSPAHIERYREAYGFSLSPAILDGPPQKVLHKYSKDSSVPVIDLLPDYQTASSNGETLFFRELGGVLDFVHPNAKGHAVAAKVIFERLLCGSLLPRPTTPRECDAR